MGGGTEAKPEVGADHSPPRFLCGGDANRRAALPGMDLEAALHVVGDFGPFQKRAVAVLVLTQVSLSQNTGCVRQKPSAPQRRSSRLAASTRRCYVASSRRARFTAKTVSSDVSQPGALYRDRELCNMSLLISAENGGTSCKVFLQLMCWQVKSHQPHCCVDMPGHVSEKYYPRIVTTTYVLLDTLTCSTTGEMSPVSVQFNVGYSHF